MICDKDSICNDICDKDFDKDSICKSYVTRILYVKVFDRNSICKGM